MECKLRKERNKDMRDMRDREKQRIYICWVKRLLGVTGVREQEGVSWKDRSGTEK